MDEARHPNGRSWGWALVGLLALIVVVETVVLAVMASLVSFVVAVVVPVVVLLLGLLVVRDVSRHWTRQAAEYSSWDDISA